MKSEVTAIREERRSLHDFSSFSLSLSRSLFHALPSFKSNFVARISPCANLASGGQGSIYIYIYIRYIYRNVDSEFLENRWNAGWDKCELAWVGFFLLSYVNERGEGGGGEGSAKGELDREKEAERG